MMPVQACKTRIYTEAKDNLGQLAAKYFEAFTMYHARGCWHGLFEDSAVIEIITPENLDNKVRALVSDIKIVNDQDAVLVTVEYVQMELI